MGLGRQSADHAAATDQSATPAAAPGAAAPGAAGPGADTAAALRRVQALNIVREHVAIAVTFGLVPVPWFDLALLSANQLAMTRSLAACHEVPFAAERVRAGVAAMLGGGLPLAGVAALSALKLLPLAGLLTGSASVALAGGATTWAVGRVFVAHFEGGGTLLDFDPPRWRRRFRDELMHGGRIVAEVRRPGGPSRVAVPG